MDLDRRTDQDLDPTDAGPRPDLDADKTLLEAPRRLLGDDVPAEISLDRYVRSGGSAQEALAWCIRPTIRRCSARWRSS
jgi:hypothetical protein